MVLTGLYYLCGDIYVSCRPVGLVEQICLLYEKQDQNKAQVESVQGIQIICIGDFGQLGPILKNVKMSDIDDFS